MNSRAITAGGRCGSWPGRLERDGYHATEIRSPSHILLAVTGGRPGRETELALLPWPPTVPGGESRRTSRSGPYDALPVLPALAPLLPGWGLAKGSVVPAGRAGTLCVALMAGPSQAGMWCRCCRNA